LFTPIMNTKKVEVGVKLLLLMRGAYIRDLFILKLPRKIDLILIRFFLFRVNFEFYDGFLFF